MRENNNLGGVLSLLSSAGKSDEGLRYFLRGDLVQMFTQESFLHGQGLKMGRSDVYPGFKTEEEFHKALALIWKHRIEGWWNYKREFLDANICTEEEFNGAFKH